MAESVSVSNNRQRVISRLSVQVCNLKKMLSFVCALFTNKPSTKKFQFNFNLWICSFNCNSIYYVNKPHLLIIDHKSRLMNIIIIETWNHTHLDCQCDIKGLQQFLFAEQFACVLFFVKPIQFNLLFKHTSLFESFLFLPIL